MKPLPTGREWSTKMHDGDPELYRTLVARFGFDFTFGRWLFCTQRLSQTDNVVSSRIEAFKNHFCKKIGLTFDPEATISEADLIQCAASNSMSGYEIEGEKIVILRGIQ